MYYYIYFPSHTSNCTLDSVGYRTCHSLLAVLSIIAPYVDFNGVWGISRRENAYVMLAMNV